MKKTLGLLAALGINLGIGIGLGIPPVFASDWQTAGGGNWHDGGNWSAGIPNAVGATADFTADLAANATINLNGNATVGNMSFADGAVDYYSYIVSGANTLTFDNPTVPALLSATRGTANEIATGVSLTDNLAVSVSNSANIDISGTLSGGGQLQLGRVDTTAAALRLSGDNISWAGGIQLSGGGGAAYGYGNYYSAPLQIAHANALGTGTIVTVSGGGNGYGGELSNQTGGVLTVNNDLNGRMQFTGDGFILNGNLTFSRYSVGADLTFPTGLPAGDKYFSNYGVPSGKTVRLLNASTGNLTSVAGTGSTGLRVEMHHDDALGTDLSKSVSVTSSILVMVAANGPRTIAKNFSGGWSVDGSETLTLTGNTTGAYSIAKNGSGLLVLEGTNSASSSMVVNNGVMRLASTGALPGAQVRLGESATVGGILELTPQFGDFTREMTLTYGIANTIRWNNYASGGFSAYGGDRLVSLNIGGTPNAPIEWSNGGFTSQALILNSIHADSKVEFTNDVSFDGAGQGAGMRTIWVNDNPNSTSDYAEMSGTLSGSYTHTAGLIKEGSGTLLLTGNNTYQARTEIRSGTLIVGHSNALGTVGTPQVFSGATLGVAGGITFLRPVTWYAGSEITGTGIYQTATAGWTVPENFTISPGASPGELGIDVGAGTLLLNGTSTLNIELVSDSVFDLITVTGSATLDGTLAVTMLGGYVPGFGTSFDIMTTTGTLNADALALDPASTGLFAFQVIDGNILRLTSQIPEPASLTLLALAGLLFMRRRRG